jgi:hypothetical protein
MGYSSVQIFGRDATVKAFRNTDCINWSLLQGKQLLFKYEGSDQSEGGNQLDALLKMIADSSGSDAVYTLRWYERDDIPEPKQGKVQKAAKQVPKYKIYLDTPFDGSVNFKLFNQEGEGGRHTTFNDLTDLKKQVADTQMLLQQLIKDRNQEDSETEKVSGITGFINGLMDVPEIKQAIAGKVIQLFNGVTSKVGDMISGSHQVPAKIAGPQPGDLPAQPIHMPQEQIDKLNSALVILANCDPQLPDHLYKLAMIAKNDQATYDTLLGMLNKM